MNRILTARIGCDSIVTAVAVWLLANAQPGFTLWGEGVVGRGICVLAVLAAMGAVLLIDRVARNQPVMAIFIATSILASSAAEHFGVG